MHQAVRYFDFQDLIGAGARNEYIAQGVGIHTARLGGELDCERIAAYGCRRGAGGRYDPKTGKVAHDAIRGDLVDDLVGPVGEVNVAEWICRNNPQIDASCSRNQDRGSQASVAKRVIGCAAAAGARLRRRYGTGRRSGAATGDGRDGVRHGDGQCRVRHRRCSSYCHGKRIGRYRGSEAAIRYIRCHHTVGSQWQKRTECGGAVCQRARTERNRS